MSSFKQAMSWLEWAAGGDDQYVVINAEIERLRNPPLREEIERLQKELKEKQETLNLVLEKMAEACGMLANKDKCIEELRRSAIEVRRALAVVDRGFAAKTQERNEELEKENDRLRNLSIIQEGASIRPVIGGEDG